MTDGQTDRHMDRQTFLGKYHFRFSITVPLNSIVILKIVAPVNQICLHHPCYGPMGRLGKRAEWQSALVRMFVWKVSNFSHGQHCLLRRKTTSLRVA